MWCVVRLVMPKSSEDPLAPKSTVTHMPQAWRDWRAARDQERRYEAQLRRRRGTYIGLAGAYVLCLAFRHAEARARRMRHLAQISSHDGPPA